MSPATTSRIARRSRVVRISLLPVAGRPASVYAGRHLLLAGPQPDGTFVVPSN